MSVPGVASRAADRFYCPPPRRHLLHHHHNQASKAAAAAVERQPRSAAAAAKEEEEETNLECFIASTAVRVPAHRLPRTSSSSRERGAAGAPPYYELADLWEAFAEWSAYGAGVPLLLNGTDGVVQYYVPFLSAIQLFAARPPSSTSGYKPLSLSA
jgi:hypothetical protein